MLLACNPFVFLEDEFQILEDREHGADHSELFANPIQSMSMKKDEDGGQPFVAAVSELLFALLPFAVVFIVFTYQKKGWVTYLMAPEWAFASALLFGQSIVKIVQGVLSPSVNPNTPAIVLTISLLIVFGLVPSMVLLAIVLTSTEAPLWIGITQVILAIIASVSFVLFAAVAHEYANPS